MPLRFGARVGEHHGEIAPAGAEIGCMALEVVGKARCQEFGTIVDPVMGEHAGCGVETAFDADRLLGEFRNDVLRIFRAAEPEGDAVIFRQAVATPAELADTLAQRLHAIFLGTGNDDQAAELGALQRFGNPVLVLALVLAQEQSAAS